ncbi:hypothetical protein Tco_0505350 [Tanacetum coccineum]
MSNFMASQDARLSKFEGNFKQQEREMTNKIDTYLKPINDRMTGALLEDTVKNPKLNVNSTSLASSACSYPIEDPQRLELGKNRPAFIQGEMPKKMKDPELFTLPCRLRDSNPFDALADLGSCVNLIPLYLFKTLNVGILKVTENILGLADGTRSQFEKHWKEIHVTWAQLEKKRDKDTTLHDLDGALDLQGMETASRFLSTSSKLEGDDFTILSDDVTVAYLKKLIEDSAG